MSLYRAKVRPPADAVLEVSTACEIFPEAQLNSKPHSLISIFSDASFMTIEGLLSTRSQVSNIYIYIYTISYTAELLA